MSECNDTCKYYKHCWSRGEGLKEDGEECVYYEPERPHGEWVWEAYDPDYNCGDIVCSKCSVVVYEGVPQDRLKGVLWHFCPKCGADMRKEGEAE